MRGRDHTRNTRAIQEAMTRAERFWRQEVYAPVRAVPGKDGQRYQLFHRLIGVFRRMPGKTWVLMTIATLFLSGRWFVRGSAPALALSLSANNERALAPVLNVLERLHGLKAETGRERPSMMARFRALRRLAQAVRAKNALPEPQDDFTDMKQYLTAANTLLFLDSFARAKPRLVFAANDHAAPAMAFQAAASILGIPCVYVQHAPVTPHFPPLVCSLAILQDEYSKDCYEQSARDWGYDNQSRVSILPPGFGPLPPATVPNPPLKTCLVLSHHPEMAAVKALVKELQGLATVGEITIRRHPRWRGQIDCPGCRVDAGELPLETADTGALYILANSGSAVELLRNGQWTLFHGELDSLFPDYYGLVARGLLPRYEVALVASKERLQEVFNQRWRERLEALTGAHGMSQDEAEAALARAIDDLLSDGRV